MRRGVPLAAALAAVATSLALAPGRAGPLLPTCAGTTLRLAPQYAAGVPGPASAEAATLALVARADDSVETGTTPLRAEVLETRTDTAIVGLFDAVAIRGVAHTTAHPAGGWMVDELWTCSQGAPR